MVINVFDSTKLQLNCEEGSQSKRKNSYSHSFFGQRFGSQTCNHHADGANIAFIEVNNKIEYFSAC